MLNLLVLGRANVLNEDGEIIFEVESSPTVHVILPIHELHFVEGNYIGYINQRGTKCAVDVSMATEHRFVEAVSNAV